MCGELNWNKVILESMTACRYSDIDWVFSACENKLYELKAPEKEIALRLYAFAFYCDKIHNREFSKTAVFTRFAEILNLAHFERTIKKLMKKEDPALVVFWTLFRLSFGKTVMQRQYRTIEKKMRFSILPSL